MGDKTKLVFYGAISVDGYIARENHSLDWLLGTEGEEDIGYSDFYATVDIILMGKKTYDEILIHMPDEFPYKGKECYVFSRSTTGTTDYVEFINEDIIRFTKSLKEHTGKRIWIVGGGEVLYPLLQEKLVDEFIIQIAPSIIGRGIPLFLPGDQENQLRLIDVKQYKQMAELHYELK
ncbi:dihydrofolate reductase family protein [Alicyclobacillus fastidiosus]|uniref:Dihydrofolate reductase family protein n=1 Tax=Alicyclobacillus fastidiosus TaxID=392011 RepID=A0ABY6ZMQ5_9BACL|nr:dihydrofolate reductase family protein [Alicyclobacillus fastidiosus]WAH44110.1 dihydrofolate reductase family protein [Alicyclobacillus fastidiosus]GMA60407.1 dihydrofolate reductase [Alicyclobacillus fastidiosus]